jgi:hypothetical protein
VDPTGASLSYHKESSGLKTPPSKTEASEAEPVGLDCGSPEHRSTLSEDASTQDECIGAATSLEIRDDGDQAFESSQEAIAEIDKISKSKLQMTLQGLKASQDRSLKYPRWTFETKYLAMAYLPQLTQSRSHIRAIRKAKKVSCTRSLCWLRWNEPGLSQQWL